MIKRLTDDPLPLAVARPDVRFPPGCSGCWTARWPAHPRTATRRAADFGRDVRELATHSTGPVDVEAGTQVVPPAEDAEGDGPPADPGGPAVQRRRSGRRRPRPADAGGPGRRRAKQECPPLCR